MIDLKFLFQKQLEEKQLQRHLLHWGRLPGGDNVCLRGEILCEVGRSLRIPVTSGDRGSKYALVIIIITKYALVVIIITRPTPARDLGARIQFKHMILG